MKGWFFGTNPASPEIKALSISKVSPKMEAKWWSSQRWVYCRRRRKVLSQN